MPELPEVETTVRGLARYLDGARIERVALNRPDMRFPFPQGLVQALTGARVTGLGRRAKYGLIHTDRGDTLAASHALPLSHVDPRAVCITSDDAVAVIDLEHVAVAVLATNLCDRP